MSLVKERNNLHLNLQIPLSSWRLFTVGVHVNKQNTQRIGYLEHAKVAFQYQLIVPSTPLLNIDLTNISSSSSFVCVCLVHKRVTKASMPLPLFHIVYLFPSLNPRCTVVYIQISTVLNDKAQCCLSSVWSVIFPAPDSGCSPS